MVIKGHKGTNSVTRFLADWDGSRQHAKRTGMSYGDSRIPYVIHDGVVHWGREGGSHQEVLAENDLMPHTRSPMGFMTMWPRADSGDEILIEHTGGSQTYKSDSLAADDRRAIEEYVKAQMPGRRIRIDTHDKR